LTNDIEGVYAYTNKTTKIKNIKNTKIKQYERRDGRTRRNENEKK
jgi:hypothetical protein